jgi:predicted dehydrogenase
MESSYERPYYENLSAQTETDIFGLNPAYVYGGLKGDVSGKPMDFIGINQQAAQMDAFARNIMDGTECLVPGEMGARDMFIIDKIYESMASGKEASLIGLPEVRHLV